jgi:uncharacterized protein
LEWYYLLLLVPAGFVAGFINTLAGSGSLLTLPLFMAFGLPAPVANGTNRIGIFLQGMVGVWTYRKEKIIDFRTALKLGIPSVLGSLIGTLIAVDINEQVMETTIGVLLLAMFFLILLAPDRFLKSRQGAGSLPFWAQMLVFFVIGIYGGFIQAGVGFFILGGLVLASGFDLVKANALKVLLIFLYTPFSLAIFMFNHQVDYKMGLITSIGMMAGAWVGVKVTVKWGPKLVRVILLAVILVAAVKLLGVF